MIHTTSWTRRLIARATLVAVYLKTLLILVITGKASLWECVTGQFRPRASPWRVTKMLCFREPPRDDDEDPYATDYVVLDHSSMDMSRLRSLDIEVLRRVPPEWENWKVEIRCQRGTKKRRLVVRKGECVDMFGELAARPDHLTVSAVLESPETFQPLDVKDRVAKYVVSEHRPLYARDLFPVDDHAALRSRFGHLRLRTACGDRFVERYLPFDAVGTADCDLRGSCVPAFVTIS